MTSEMLSNIYVLVLAAFLGFEVIKRVSPLLHTPLMSLTNALDAIAVVGAIVIVGERESTLATVLGTLAVIAASDTEWLRFLARPQSRSHVRARPF